jgi:hypothetical protein
MGIRGTTPHVEISDDGTVRFSTLIEEGKGRVTEKRGHIDENRRGAVKQREATRGTSSSDTTGSARRRQAENSPDRNFDVNLRICRGC